MSSAPLAGTASGGARRTAAAGTNRPGAVGSRAVRPGALHLGALRLAVHRRAGALLGGAGAAGRRGAPGDRLGPRGLLGLHDRLGPVRLLTGPRSAGLALGDGLGLL